MKSREYDKRIEIWEISRVPDDYGGFTVTSEKISSSWAKLQTDGLGRKAYNMGIVEFNDPLLFLVRGRNDLPYNGRTLFLMYRGDKYIIQGIKDTGNRNIDVEIFCIKEEPVEIAKIGVIGTLERYPYSYPFGYGGEPIANVSYPYFYPVQYGDPDITSLYPFVYPLNYNL